MKTRKLIERSIEIALVMAIIITVYLWSSGCASVQTVKPYEIGKVTSESILFDARIMQNKGMITEDQFNKVRGVYDKLAKAQDIAIDARKTLITYNTPGNKKKAQDTFNSVLSLSTDLFKLAQEFGIMKGEK